MSDEDTANGEGIVKALSRGRGLGEGKSKPLVCLIASILIFRPRRKEQSFYRTLRVGVGK